MRSHSKFTLIEIMFVVGILVILIGISWTAGVKVLRQQAKAKTKAEISILNSACEQYKNRFGQYPDTTGNLIDFNFNHHLSDVSYEERSQYIGTRPMYIDCKKHNIHLSGNIVLDPYEQPYKYKFEDHKIKIWSLGLDGVVSVDDVY